MSRKQDLLDAIRNAIEGFDCSDAAQLDGAMDAVNQTLSDPVFNPDTNTTIDPKATALFDGLNKATQRGHHNMCSIVGVNPNSDLCCWLLESRMQAIVDERDKFKHEFEMYMARRKTFMEQHGHTNENSFSCITSMIHEIKATQLGIPVTIVQSITMTLRNILKNGINSNEQIRMEWILDQLNTLPEPDITANPKLQETDKIRELKQANERTEPEEEE